MIYARQSVCGDIHSWLLAKLPSDVSEVDHHWREHVVRCATCRGGILLLAYELFGRPDIAYTHVTCEMCQRDLAPYIDLVQIEGGKAAAQRFPHIWWHLWTCATCAETYEMTTALVEAEASGELVLLDFKRELVKA